MLRIHTNSLPPAHESVTARIPQSVKRQAERDARREHRSLGGHIAWIIAQYYGDRPGVQEERMTNQQRQRARYEELIRTAREAVEQDIEKE